MRRSHKSYDGRTTSRGRSRAIVADWDTLYAVVGLDALLVVRPHDRSSHLTYASKDQSCDRSYVVISKSYVIVPPVVNQKSYDHLQPFPKRSYVYIITMLHYAVEAATQKNIYKHKYTKVQAQNHLKTQVKHV